LLLHDQYAVARLGGTTPPEARFSRTGRAKTGWRRGVSGPGNVRQPPVEAAQKAPPCCKRKSNLRGKRSDPFHGANDRPTAGAVPVAKVGMKSIAVTSSPRPVRWSRQGSPNRAQRPHSTDPGGQPPGRSRHETETSACCGEWRRGARGPRMRERLTCAREERAANALSIFDPEAERSASGSFCLPRGTGQDHGDWRDQPPGCVAVALFF
jgi:hypothetical protein